jgi:iron complex transport system ATP-binding protein
MPIEPILQVSRLTLRRGRKTLLRDLSWTILPQQNWVIMGPNGCGKTSLLRSLVGFLTPTSGDIALMGETYGETDWREVRRSIALVSSSLQPHIPGGEPAVETVISGIYDQLDFWGNPTPADYRLARKLLRQLDVAEVVDREWAYLSQGERQRVLIARALAAAPDLLILDEPCAGLDPLARADFLTALESMLGKKGGPAVVLVTHHVEEITPSFDQVLLLSAGRAVAAGPIRKTLTTAELSRAFGRAVRLSRTADQWRLQLPSKP